MDKEIFNLLGAFVSFEVKTFEAKEGENKLLKAWLRQFVLILMVITRFALKNLMILKTFTKFLRCSL